MTTRLRWLVIALVLGLWTANGAEAQNVFPGKDWQEEAPESQGVDSGKLKAAVDYMDANFSSQGAQELAIVYWWTNDVMPSGKRSWPSAPPRTYMSNGKGCNFCMVLPEWNLVIVRMGTIPVPSRDRDQKFDKFFGMVGEALGASAASKRQ